MSGSPVYAGIDIGGTNIKFGLVDSSGKVLFRDQKPTPTDKGADPVMHLVTNVAENLLFHAAEDELDVRWLGVGTPGAVDEKTGTVVGPCPNIPGWTGMPIGNNLRDRLNMPVLVDNDVNVMALAEAKFGVASGYKAVVCLAIGTGIGGALVIDGDLWRGSHHAAGEIGQMTIDLNGPDCRAGNPGCLEAYCASPAIIKRATARLKKEMTPVFTEILGGNLENLTIRKLFNAAKKGDAVATEVIDETAHYLGAGLANVVNLLNPDIVVLGGGVTEAGGGLLEAVTKVVRERAIPPAVEELRIARGSLGNDAGFIGAGILGEFRSW